MSLALNNWAQFSNEYPQHKFSWLKKKCLIWSYGGSLLFLSVCFSWNLYFKENRARIIIISILIRKDEDHDLWYGPEPLAEFRRVSMCHLSHWSGEQQHLLQWLQVLGAQEMQWAQALDKGPWLQMYMVPGNCTPLRWQTTEGSPSDLTSWRW